MTNGTRENRERANKENYPGFNHPLTFCPLKAKHKPAMMKAIWSSHSDLRDFIGWAKYSRSWNARDISRFVDDHLNDSFPNQHFVFWIGEEIVGFGSLLECYTNLDVQISLFVTQGFQGLGIGKKMVDTLTYLAFEVWGFSRLYYEHDARNEMSKRLPQKCGFRYSHSKDYIKTAQGESGFWFSWVKRRPPGIPDGILQGRPIEDFTQP